MLRLLLFTALLFLSQHMVIGQEYHQDITLSLEEFVRDKSKQKTLTKLWQEAADYCRVREKKPEGVYPVSLHIQTLGKKSQQYTHEMVLRVDKLPGKLVRDGLNLSTVMLPTHISFEVKKGGNVLFPAAPQRWENGMYRQRFLLSDTANGNWEVSPVIFSYDEDLLEDRWKTLKALTENYPKEADRARKVNQMLNSINLEDPQQLDTVIFILADIEKQLDTLNQYTPLTQWRTDPMQFETLQDRYTMLRQTLSEISQDRYLMYYQQGRDALTEDRTNDALTAFDKATAYNPDFLPPYQEMARIAYLKGDFEEAAFHLEYLWNHPNLENDLRRQARALFYDIYYFFQQSAQNEAAKLRFSAAIDFLNKAEELCLRIPARPNCQSDIKSRIQQVRDSEFEYLIGNARQAMYEDQFAKALRLLQQAKGYQMSYPDMVSRNKNYFNETAQEMYELCISRAAEVRKEKSAGEAIDYLRFSESMKEDYSALKAPENLEEVYRNIYQQYAGEQLAQAEKHLEAQALNEALDVTLSLTSLQEKQKTYIKPDQQAVNALFTKIYRGFLQKGEEELKAGDFRNAVDDLRLTTSIPEAAYQPSEEEQERKREGILTAYLGLSAQAKEQANWREAFGFLTRAAVNLPDDPEAPLRVRYREQQALVLPQYAQTLLKEADQNIDDKNMQAARQTLEDLQTLQTDYGWRPGKKEQKRLKKLSKKLR